MQPSYATAPKNNFSLSSGAVNDLVVCPHCRTGISSPKVKYSGGKGKSSPLFWCSSCQKKFGIRHGCISWQRHFIRLYIGNFTKPHEVEAIKARYNDFILPKSIRLFDANLRKAKKVETSADTAIEKAFLSTMRTLIDKAVLRWREKECDNWSIVINRYDSEQSYDLDFKLLKMENSGVIFRNKRDEDNPLIRCAHCSGTHIVRNGFSNIGHRRFKCVDCNRSSILRGRNLFSFEYVKNQILKLYLQSFQFKTGSLPVLEKICNELAVLFMDEANMARISKKLQTEFTVSELFRVNMIEIFVKKHSGNYEIVQSKPSEVFEGMIVPSNTLLLPRPEEHTGVDASEVLRCSRA